MKRLVTLLVVFLSLITCSVYAQVTIAPTNLFIDNQSKFGSYMVINGSDTPQEVSIEFFFGYSDTDRNGERTSVTEANDSIEQYSIAEHIRAFPKNFALQPGQRQVVRLRISPPGNLDEGTYWARIKTTSSPESPPVEVTSSEAVSAHVGINIEQITGLFYKNGTTTTGIEIEQIRPVISDESENELTVLTDFKRTGNSPFLGSITVSLTNQNGETVTQGFTSTTLYFDGTHRQRLDISDIPSGEYTVRVNFESRRNDVSQSDLVQMKPVTATTTLTIP